MKLTSAIRLMRPYQWVKNLVVAGPLAFTPAAASAGNLVLVGLGVLCFCALSSAVYALNDLLDCERDRMHAEKCKRPVASGDVAPWQAMALSLICGLGALALAFALDTGFGVVCFLYAVMNIAYSIYLKHVEIVDVLLISASFLLRVYAGSELIGYATGPWIQLCVGLLALFLALGKRRDDLVREMATSHRASLEGYNKAFLDSAMTMILSSVLVSYVIYTTSQDVAEKLGTPHMYATVPFVVAGMLRYLQLVFVYHKSGDPTQVLLKDKPSIAIVLGWVVTTLALIYGFR